MAMNLILGRRIYQIWVPQVPILGRRIHQIWAPQVPRIWGPGNPHPPVSPHAPSTLRFPKLAAFASLFALAGCRTAESTFNWRGPAAHRISNLSWAMTILFLVTTFIMWALFAIAFYRRRGSLAEHEPVESGGGEMWIAIGGTAIPLIVLTTLFVVGLALLHDFPIHGMRNGLSQAQMAQAMKPEIRITGYQWWWKMEYLNDDPSKDFVTANELHLPAGRPVNIEVEAGDVMHSFWIPALHGKVDLIPGQPNYIRLIASQTGTYTGQCAEFCGAEHARMRLLAVVQTPADYQAWLEDQRRPGATPASPDAQAGEKVFATAACAFCHTVRGTPAHGTVAPDLTHIASRQMLASDVYPNNTSFLEAWITNAQSLKPGALMPDLPDFSGQQLRDLVAYLQQLH